MAFQLTPCVLPAQRDLPAVRVVLLDQGAQQIGATAYSFQALELVFQQLSCIPEAVKRYGLTSSTVQSRLDSVRPLAQQAKLPEHLCKVDVERLATLSLVAVGAKTLVPGVCFTLEAGDQRAEELALPGIVLDWNNPNAVSLMRFGGEPKKAIKIFSKKALRFAMSMGVTHQGLTHYKVQQIDLLHARTILEVLDLYPRCALPNTHPAEDAALLARMSNECGEDLLAQYSAYKPPIG
jgi:hypothetical protein